MHLRKVFLLLGLMLVFAGAAAHRLGAATVDLAWTSNSTNHTGFTIERAVGAGAFAVLANVAANVVTYADTAAQDGTTYRYRVFAYNGAGPSQPSNIATVAVPVPETPPAAPGELQGTPRTPPPYQPPTPTISMAPGETLTVVARADAVVTVQ